VDFTPPPVPSITQKPPAVAVSASASFSFTDTEAGVTFACSLDGAPPAVCTSPQPYSSLAEGQHTFAVTAADGGGNTSGPASWTWTVDTVPPDTTITDGPSGPTASAAADFSFISDDPAATFQCALDTGAFAACTSPRSYTNLSAGDHTFTVRAVDAAGNQDPTPDSRAWSVQSSFPDTTITGGPASGAWVGSASATFSFTSDIAGGTFDCSLDGAPYAPCESGGTGAVLTGLAQGAHTFAVAASAGGFTDPTPASRTWNVDSVPPVVSLTAPDPDEFLLTSPVAVKWTGTDPAPSSGALTYALLERPGASAGYGTVASGSARQATRAVGTTTCWMATATDPAGNTGATADVCAAVPFDDRSTSLVVAGPVAQVADAGAYQSTITRLQVADAGAYQSTITRLQGAGAEVSLSFTGRKVGVLMQKAPDTGKAQIFVDGTLVQTVDTYASSIGQKKFLWNGFVAAGPHTVRVAWTGTKNKNSTGFDVPLDGIAIIATP
jgi:hypothetical protein